MSTTEVPKTKDFVDRIIESLGDSWFIPYGGRVPDHEEKRRIINRLVPPNHGDNLSDYEEGE